MNDLTFLQEKTTTIAILGIGYIGLVTAACFAKTGHQVICADIDQKKIANLNKHKISIYEPELNELIINYHICKKLEFVTDVKYAIENSQLIFITVGTPQTVGRDINLKYVINAAQDIGNFINAKKIIINKATAPVGTTNRIANIIFAKLKKRKLEHLSFTVVSNPEFLKEGTAVNDFLNPDRIIVGTNDKFARKVMEKLYAPFLKTLDQLLFMDIATAEFTKYVSNAMLATKISFINEIANIATRLNINIKDVCKGISLDTRIGAHFLEPGCGYGGSCLPKDLNALIKLSSSVYYKAILLEAVDSVNIQQQNQLFLTIKKYFNNNLHGRKIAVWGLSFKPNTNDIREASSCKLIKSLLDNKVNIRAFDPQATEEIAKLYGQIDNFLQCSTKEACLKNADALVICTEWQDFLNVNFSQISSYMKEKVIFDGRNIFNYQLLKKYGFKYYGIGYGDVLSKSPNTLFVSEV